MLTIACPDCGTIEELPALPPRGIASCVRCDAALEKRSGRSTTAALACSLATLVLLVPSNLMPLIRVHVFGMRGDNVTLAGIGLLFERGWIVLAVLAGLMVVVAPFLRFGLLTLALGCVRLRRRPWWLARAFRWAIWLDRWAMLDIYLLAAGVGFYRLQQTSRLHVEIAVGGLCFVAAALLTMLTRATLDQRTVWRAIGGEVEAAADADLLSCTTCDVVQPLSDEGQRCVRCHARLHARRPWALSRTAALLLAAFVLFLLANIYPMNVSSRLGEQQSYTIFTGVQELVGAGLWPLAVLIFCTSILIPMGKMLGIGWCVVSVWRRSDRHLERKTKTFRLVAELGRWSKTDPWVIVFFVPLVNFGALGSQDAGWGATAFVVMTLLTMMASTTFDPRLIWDAAEREAPAGSDRRTAAARDRPDEPREDVGDRAGVWRREPA